MEATTPIYVLGALAAYLLGSFPTGVVLTRRKFGIDVREMGSGNIGATNVTRVFGWYAGVLVFVIDFLKGALPVWLARHYFPQAPWLASMAAIAVVLGHCFSLYISFRGGKGVATSFGCLAVVVPIAALVSGVVYGVTLAVTRISAVGSLAGIITTLAYIAIFEPSLPVAVLILGMSTVVIFRHHSNIRRLWDGFQTKSRAKVSK